jgi:hypothetical protein
MVVGGFEFTGPPTTEKIKALRNPEIRQRLIQEEGPSTAGMQIMYKQDSAIRLRRHNGGSLVRHCCASACNTFRAVAPFLTSNNPPASFVIGQIVHEKFCAQTGSRDRDRGWETERLLAGPAARARELGLAESERDRRATRGN